MKWGQAQDYPKVGKNRMTKYSFQLRGHEEFINVLETKKEKKKREQHGVINEREAGIRSEMETA